MPRFSVQAPEIWMQWYDVEADSEDEARAKVMMGHGTPIDGPSYIDTLDDVVEDWLVLSSQEAEGLNPSPRVQRTSLPSSDCCE